MPEKISSHTSRISPFDSSIIIECSPAVGGEGCDEFGIFCDAVMQGVGVEGALVHIWTAACQGFLAM